MAERCANLPPEDARPAATPPKTEREKYGERLNTVRGSRCPKHRSSTTMSVHPGHRVYHPCGCAHELPPLPTQRPHSTRRRSGKPQEKGRRR